MTNEDQNSENERTITLTQEELSAAANAEQVALQEVTNNHLNNRVVTLRALVNRLQTDLDEAKLKLEAHELHLEESEETEPAA